MLSRLIGVITPMRLLPVFLVALIALVAWFAATELRASDRAVAEDQIPLADARMIIEFNSSDEDTGIQVFLDGEPWKELKIVNPAGRTIFEVEGKRKLKKLGLTELFFESNEPSLEDLPLEKFLALFPEGEYRFSGETVDGDDLVGAATFSHDIPGGPVIVSPGQGVAVNPGNAIVSWEAAADPPEIEIVGYQVIVERSDPDRVFTVTLPATTTSVTIPEEFLDSATQYKFEVLAIEASGNQTITEGLFQTE